MRICCVWTTKLDSAGGLSTRRCVLKIHSFFSLGFATADDVPEKDCIFNDFYVKSEERPVVANSNAVNVSITDKFLAVGDVFDIFSVSDFLNNVTDGLKHLAGKLSYGLFEVL